MTGWNTPCVTKLVKLGIVLMYKLLLRFELYPSSPRGRCFKNVRARYGVTVERVQVVGVSVPVSLRKLTGTVCT